MKMLLKVPLPILQILHPQKVFQWLTLNNIHRAMWFMESELWKAKKLVDEAHNEYDTDDTQI